MTIVIVAVVAVMILAAYGLRDVLPDCDWSQSETDEAATVIFLSTISGWND